MTRMTLAEVLAHNAKVSGKALPAGEAIAAGTEKKLHQKISEDLTARRWFFVHSRCDRPTTQAAGVPDFIIAKPDGVTIWIECKAKGGKLSVEQNVTRHVLLALDHRFALVYSFADYLKAVL